jgi:flagellar basal body-associated protein FliL
MATNENELSKDAIDDDLQDLEDPDFGIELDKVEIPKTDETDGPDTISEEPSPVKPESAPPPDEPESARPPAEPEAVPLPSPPKKKIPLVLIAAPACVILIILGFFMMKTLLPVQRHEKAQPPQLGTYAPVEPMLTNLGDDRHIEIWLMSRSAPGNKEQTSILLSQAKHHIIMLVTSAEIQRQLADGVSEELVASHIHDEITLLLAKNFPNQIILKELMVR